MLLVRQTRRLNETRRHKVLVQGNLVSLWMLASLEKASQRHGGFLLPKSKEQSHSCFGKFSQRATLSFSHVDVISYPSTYQTLTVFSHRMIDPSSSLEDWSMATKVSLEPFEILHIWRSLHCRAKEYSTRPTPCPTEILSNPLSRSIPPPTCALVKFPNVTSKECTLVFAFPAQGRRTIVAKNHLSIIM
jgi:hypothetical protein